MVDTLGNIFKACQCEHSAFPVTNRSGRVVGLISKNYLIILISQKAFYHNKKGIASYNEKAYSSKDSGVMNASGPDGGEDGEKKLLNDSCAYEDSTETLEFDTMPVDDTKVTLSW